MEEGSARSFPEYGSTSPRTRSVGADDSNIPPASVEEGSEEQRRYRHHGNQQRRRHLTRRTITYRATIFSSSPPAANDAAATGFYEGTREETWTCLVVLLTFCSFAASMTMILGFYGSANLVLGPNSSRIISANSLFVQSIKLQSDTGKQGAELYEFSERPPLDVEVTWSEIHNVSMGSLPKEWMYYLNEGSHISISYNVNSLASYPLVLIIAKGEQSLHTWLQDPLFPATTLSWNLINGSGFVHQKILKSSEYYIAVGNMNSGSVEVQLNFDIAALLFNTTGAASKCSLNHSLCVAKLPFLDVNVAILATSALQQNEDGNELYVKLSYEPRWITYFFFSASMTIIILLAFKTVNYVHYNSRSSQATGAAPERAPLLLNKDDDSSSLGSSYDSASDDGNDIEDQLDILQNESGTSRWSKENDSHCLCAICLEAARDSFFLPCGHCAACFTCGTRVLEDHGTCPQCQRRTKKVKKIFAT